MHTRRPAVRTSSLELYESVGNEFEVANLRFRIAASIAILGELDEATSRLNEVWWSSNASGTGLGSLRRSRTSAMRRTSGVDLDAAAEYDTRSVEIAGQLDLVMVGILRAAEPRPGGPPASWALRGGRAPHARRAFALAKLPPGVARPGTTPAEKDSTMQAFRAGRTQVLVATSVVEVGVDVPNATLMTIEGGERFGLAQLHQLRGRISRGAHPGYLCVFATPASDEAAGAARRVHKDQRRLRAGRARLSASRPRRLVWHTAARPAAATNCRSAPRCGRRRRSPRDCAALVSVRSGSCQSRLYPPAPDGLSPLRRGARFGRRGMISDPQISTYFAASRCFSSQAYTSGLSYVTVQQSCGRSG